MKMHKALRLLFVEREIGQNEVAHQIGIAESTMTARMNGKQPWTSWEMEKMGALLDIPPEKYHLYFFDRTGRREDHGQAVK